MKRLHTTNFKKYKPQRNNNNNKPTNPRNSTIPKMRTSKNMRLMSTDLKRLQKSIKQKTDKQVESLVQLIDLPDFDISEFFQALSRSSNQEEVLSRIPADKQIQFFSRNFQTFIETQEQLAQMKLPELQWIPRARQFKFEEPQVVKNQQDLDKSSVLEIVDSFGAVVLQKNTKEVVKLLNIIKQMKTYEKYRPYFQIYSINQLFRESYQTFIENCDEKQILFSLEQYTVALRKFLKQKSTDFISKVRTDMNVDSSARGLGKIMQKLKLFLQTTMRQCKQQFPSQKMSNPIQIDIIIPKFLSDLTKQFYQTIEPCVYQKQQLSQILQSLEIVLQCSAELQSKGINLARDFRQLISHDLPMHMNKIIEVVIEAFDDILKEDNSLYEFKFFDSLSSLGQEVQELNPIKYGQYGKKCASKKGILLVNAFVIIMQPLCDEKWAFLQANVLKELLEKVSGALETNWHYWDYCQLFYFFDRMKSGKIKHKRLFSEGQIPLLLKQRIQIADKIKMECWDNFETKLTNKFWVQILCKIPKNLWEIKDYLRIQSDPPLKPTIFSLDLIFSVQMFLRDFQFRLQKIQFEHLITRFYEYIMYVIQYVIYYEYHAKGTSQKVFTLFKKSERIFKKTKNFSMEDIEAIKEKKRAVIGMFTKGGVKLFALDMYFFTEALKLMTEYQKFNCEQFVEKISQIEAKQHKDAAISVTKQVFNNQIESSIKVYKQEPQKIRQYMQKKRRQLSKNKQN